MNRFSVFLCVVAAIASASATDYCASSLCDGAAHIGCGNSGKFVSTCPSNAAMIDITDDLKKIVTDAHNERRNFIAGGGDAKHKPAARMATMQWDSEMASLAALNVRQCKMSHDKCRNTDTFRYSGQNLALFGTSGSIATATLLKNSVTNWYNEVANSNQAYIDSYPNGYTGPTIGHYTVMMADKNTNLGCAASKYTPVNSTMNYYVVACNYATTNMINWPIYASSGVAASACTTGRNPSYPNLCSASEVYNVNKWY